MGAHLSAPTRCGDARCPGYQCPLREPAHAVRFRHSGLSSPTQGILQARGSKMYATFPAHLQCAGERCAAWPSQSGTVSGRLPPRAMSHSERRQSQAPCRSTVPSGHALGRAVRRDHRRRGVQPSLWLRRYPLYPSRGKSLSLEATGNIYPCSCHLSLARNTFCTY
jgi:hypothetical protein